MGRKGAIVRQAVYSALSSLAVQGVAIVSLSPVNYGLFSLYFLVYALGSSLVFSAVSEAWVRTPTAARSPWPLYCSALALISIMCVVPSAIMGIWAGSALTGIAMSAAVALATFRVGARYYATVENETRFVGPPDLASSLAMIGAFILARTTFSELEAVALSWCVSCIVAVVLSKPPRFTRRNVPRIWYLKHKSAIRHLLADSALLDVGSIGVPLSMSPLLGVASFGTYRSVSSAALPVRLILTPLRPLIERRTIGFFLSRRVLAGVVSVGTALGLSIFVALFVVQARGLFDGGVLNQLAQFALPVGLFVMFNFVGNFFYLVTRTHSSGNRLLTYRVVTLCGSIALPIFGVLLSGLPGAIWGFTLNSVALSFFVIELLRREHKP